MFEWWICVQLSNGPVFEWWPENQTEKSLFMVQNVRSAKSHDLTIWIPDTHTVRYSDESDIQVFSIQMVTVFKWWSSIQTIIWMETTMRVFNCYESGKTIWYLAGPGFVLVWRTGVPNGMYVMEWTMVTNMTFACLVRSPFVWWIRLSTTIWNFPLTNLVPK